MDLLNVTLEVDVDFECHIDGKKENEMVAYRATVVFPGLKELLDAGGESVKRILQTGARKGKFPTGRRVRVDHEGKYEPTKEEKAQAVLAQIASLDATEDEAQLEALFQLYQQKKAAKLAAEKLAAEQTNA